MRHGLLAGLLSLCATGLFAQQPTTPQAGLLGPDGNPLATQAATAPRQIGVRRPILSDKVSSPQAEAAAAAKHLQLLGEDRLIKNGIRQLSSVRFFTLYAIDPEHRWEALAALNFWCNSLSRNADRVPLSPVPNTDGLLYWFYLEDYEWSPEAWEKVSAADPFFREPWIDTETAAYLRSVAGNCIVRGDWFLNYASDTQTSSAYRDLLYSTATFTRDGEKVTGQAPKTVEELNEVFFVDIEAAEAQKVDRGLFIPSGQSIVSYNNRILWRVPIPAGYYWRTFDVLEATGKKDYVETRFPKEWDGSEIIGSLPNGLQFYDLVNSKNALVDAGPASLVRDTVTPLSRFHVEVTIGASCVACHSAGIIQASDDLSAMLTGGLELYEKDYDVAKRTRLFYRGDGDLLIKEDQARYSRAVQEVTGLDPVEVSRAMIQQVVQYRQAVTVDQAARECGVSVEQFQAALSITTRGLLGDMVTRKRPIDRKTWDSERFSEAMLLVLEWKKAASSGISDKKPEPPQPVTEEPESIKE